MKKSTKNRINVFLFLLPALILFIGVLIAPLFLSAEYSFFNMKSYGPRTFIGLQNYKELFTSKSIDFFGALKNAILLAAFSVFIQLPLSLGLALMLGKGIKGERVFLSVYFLPVLISTVIIGQLFIKIYNPDYGILNVALRSMGFEQLGQLQWLGKKDLAVGAVFVPTLWQYVGYHMLLMYAGVKGVSPELREAAMLDGATDGQVNRYIVIPIIKPILKVSVIFAITGSLKAYDLIHVLTDKGASHLVEVPSTLMINMLFTRNRFGMGSAIAVMLIILCFFFALVVNRVFKEED
ncbi:MAG: sugar ABC transporter permease [Lachnospiraceae bacterium]|nr:sugar ABC transporter permease [Lachnospiraceae bacterium]